MAIVDKDIAILDAIKATLTAKVAKGEALEGIRTVWVKYTTSETTQERGIRPPILMVDALDSTGRTISIPPCMVEVVLPVRFRIFTENAGDLERKTAAVLMGKVYQEFYMQGFGIAEWVDMPSKNFNIPVSPPFETPVSGGAEMVINYTYTHAQAVPTQGTL